MELIATVAALTGIVALALAFSPYTRPGFQTGIHTLALVDTGHSPLEMRHRVAASPVESAMEPASPAWFPTLSRIDQLRPAGAVPFATDPQAPALERRALRLLAVYSCANAKDIDSLDAGTFGAVCAELERARVAAETGVQVIVGTVIEPEVATGTTA